MLGDMLVAAMLLLPRLCMPAKPLSELLEVDRDPESDAEKQWDKDSIVLQNDFAYGNRADPR